MLAHPLSTWPCFTEEEASAVRDVLLSNKVNYWTGEECNKFEQEFSSWVGCEHAIALANGTLALELALKSLGIGPDDEVIVSPRTFIASASSIIAVGATPVFADVDLQTQSITATTIRSVLTPRTKAIIVVHLAGIPADMDPIMSLADSEQLYVVEDCAQAHGAVYKDRCVGSIGHIAAWSFCQDKIMTTGGEGGMITTNCSHLWHKAWSLKDHGKSYEKVFEVQQPPGFRWLHDSFGSNYRMTEMQAAIGRIQLRYVESWLKSRQKNAQEFDRIAKMHPVVRSCNPTYGFSYAAYKHYLFVEPQFLARHWSRDRIIEELNTLGVPCFQGSCSEVYLEAAFDNTEWRPAERLENARILGETSLMFLVHPTIKKYELDTITSLLDNVLSRSSVTT